MSHAYRRPVLAVSLLIVGAMAPSAVSAHAPSVSLEQPGTPSTAIVLDDPTLSRAIGATIAQPGELDWYRMDLRAGEPIVVGMTAPDATGRLAATFVLMGPGLPDAVGAGDFAASLAAEAGAPGAVLFTPDADPAIENHAGLGFVQYGTLRMDAPVDGSYWIAVYAVDPMATGKYVLAPGVREEFGVDAFGGMADLIGFFDAPWPPVDAADGASPTSALADPAAAG